MTNRCVECGEPCDPCGSFCPDCTEAGKVDVQEELRKRFLPGSSLEQFVKTRDARNKAHEEMTEAARLLYEELAIKGHAWLHRLEKAKEAGLFIARGEDNVSFIRSMVEYLSKEGIKREDPDI